MTTADLTPGTNFEKCVFLKKSIDVKTAKNGLYIQMTLSDAFGQITVKKWQATEQEISIASQAHFLTVSGSVAKDGQYKGDVRVDYLAIAEQPENTDAFLTPFPENHDKHIERFKALMKTIQEPNLNRILRIIFDSTKTTWKQFKSASAAQYRHHAYRGGLIEHSIEVAELCDKACQVLPNLRRDFLITCALLHDIGKLEEMEHGLNAGAFTENGTLVGHTVSGAMLIGQAADEITGFPKNLKSGLMHMILSHHGRPDFGAAKAPACAEAWVLHECDNMSAKSHEYQQIASSNITPGLFSVKIKDEYYFIGDLGLQLPLNEPDKPESTKVFTSKPLVEPDSVVTFTTTRMRIRGLVAAGSPEQGNADDEETREVVPPACGADFLVRVTGDSMADEGIRERDLLFVKVIETPKNGDIVVAHVGDPGEVVKRYRSDPTGTTGQEKKWLASENSKRNYPNIPIDAETRIRGKVVGLLRDC